MTILYELEMLDGTEMAQELAEAQIVLSNKNILIDECVQSAKEYMDEDGLYLIMESNYLLKAVLKAGQEFREISSTVHVGTFQDSMLCTDWEKGEVDFRYFPNFMMEPYHWSDGLKNIYIHNIGIKDILFKGSKHIIECKANAVTKISKDNYCGEGLLSPDAVNGKCIFSERDN